jgi:small-conductance mechanosensitive channel
MDETWPSLGDLDGLYAQAADWLNANLLGGEAVPQVLAILGSFLVARVLVRSLRVRAGGLAGKIRAQRQSVVLRLSPLALPVAWALLLWFSLVALREAGVPAPAVQATISLVLAWIGIRLATSLIASPFWSRVIAVVCVAGAALRISGLWSATVHILDEMTMTIGAVRLSVLGVVEATIIFTVLLSVGAAAARWLDRWLERLRDLTPSGRVLLGKLLRIGALSLAVILALHAIGVDLTTLAVFSGAVGLGIGFGLQKVFSNLISGIILLLDRSVKPGDVIAIGDHYGWINALGARYVSVVTRDGIEHLIPNEDLIGDRVENWSHSSNLLRLHAPFSIAYGSDVPRAVAVAEQAARDCSRVLARPEPHCLLLAFGDSAIDLELRLWINDPRNGVHNVKSQVLMRLWELYRQHGIEFPYPQRDLHLKTAVPVTVVRTGDRFVRRTEP